jgi:hypothetical protein
MPQDQPQEAFHLWLRDSLLSAWNAIFRAEPYPAYLDNATDHCDLERRMASYERSRAAAFIR